MIKLSDYVIKRLEETGVRHMFMLPGGGAMHLNDSLGKSKKIQYIAGSWKDFWLRRLCEDSILRLL